MGTIAKNNTISPKDYYATYNGHRVDYLNELYDILYLSGCRNFIYFAGDSSLDNKWWLRDCTKKKPTENYDKVFSPRQMIPDVCYWTNCYLVKQKKNIVAINTAVEASTLADRDMKLLPQDLFIQQKITSHDVLIVSVGGNDIVLKPSLKTMINLNLLITTKINEIENHPSFLYIVDFFKTKIQNYIERLIINATPQQIIVCFIYWPCECKDKSSWADSFLTLSGYNKDPTHIQQVIELIYKHAIKNIIIKNCLVSPLPLYEILDSRNSDHYIERVEPSVLGGRLMAKSFVDCLN